MGSYLVWKNNCERIFCAGKTYFVMFLIPVCILFFVMISEQFSGMSQGGRDYYGVITFTEHGEDTSNMSSSEEGNREDLILEKREQTMIGMLVTIFMIVSTMYASRMIRDKKSGAMERFLCAGHSQIQYLSGYIGSVFSIVGILVTATVLLLSFVVGDADITFGGSLVLILFVTVITSLYGCFISVFSKSDMAANLTASSVAVLMSLLGGTFMEVSQMPELLQKISMISPIRWGIFLFKCKKNTRFIDKKRRHLWVLFFFYEHKWE